VGVNWIIQALKIIRKNAVNEFFLILMWLIRKINSFNIFYILDIKYIDNIALNIYLLLNYK